ncbi:MAG: LacI family DNA-binding transcriptional regulator [Melioribacteraceae bacterium]|nr:LacI family DNA-binding transcriptional regulator [Melioribacteraceae bacterium]
MKKVNIEDIAQMAGVSKGTVSGVINAKPSIKPATRERILKIMKEYNYRPKGMARYLKKDYDNKTIGIIIKDLNYTFYTAIATGVKEYANSKGYAVLMASSENSHENEQRMSNIFSSKDVKGTIIAPIVEGASEIEHLFKLKLLNYPFVLLEDVQGINANVVAIDNARAIKKAVKYLIDGGHAKIIHFAGPISSTHTHERIEAFRDAFSERDVAFKKEMIFHVGSYYDESFSKTKEYFKGRSPADYPTAIFCFNDQQAFAVMQALAELNIKVPEDISLIGNDDIDFAKYYPVPLTTIKAPQHEIGRRAAEILIKNIESDEKIEAERFIFEAELVIRKSSRTLN